MKKSAEDVIYEEMAIHLLNVVMLCDLLKHNIYASEQNKILPS